MHKTRQRQKIIFAALTQIEARGLATLSLSDIATEAAVSRQTVYNYFPDVAAVIEAALDEHGAAMAIHLGELVENVDGMSAKLQVLSEFMVKIADPAHAALPLDAGLSAEARARLARHDAAPREVLASAIAAESGREDPALADLLWSMIEAGAAAAGRNPEAKPALLDTLMAALNTALNKGISG